MAERVALEPDLSPGKLQSVEHTTHATAGTITSLPLPYWARGVRIRPRSSRVRFALTNDLAAVGTGTTFTVGGIAEPDEWTDRNLPVSGSYTLYFRSTATSVVVAVEVWG